MEISVFNLKKEKVFLKERTVLIHKTNLGGYRAAYAFFKKWYEVIYQNRGSYVDEINLRLLTTT